MVLIIALFGFVIGIGLLFLAMLGAILTVALRILTAILWVAVKVLERREARKAEPEILIVLEDEPRPMRDVTPTVRRLRAP
jgi:hypothetical protein